MFMGLLKFKMIKKYKVLLNLMAAKIHRYISFLTVIYDQVTLA